MKAILSGCSIKNEKFFNIFLRNFFFTYADDFFVNSSYLATLKANMFKSMAKNAGFKKIKLIGTGGNEEFDPKKHISLYALLERS